jgi:RNA polymerase sigma-70 factor (ECF subfamily)
MRQLLQRASEGDQSALDALIQRNCERLTSLTRQMLRGFPGVKRWTQTDDVLQNALLRLLRALQEVKPASPRDFLALATLQIRRELLDLARQLYGPEGLGRNHDSNLQGSSTHDGLDLESDPNEEAASLLQWYELHQEIDNLPDEEREVVGLLFYQGMAQAEAAELLNVSVRTVQRRWHSALWKLHARWNGKTEES